jgi:alpha-tubulin suppressor-like RCC1 family protein
MDIIPPNGTLLKRNRDRKVTIAAGRRHTVGLKSDGTVVAVGDNKFGQYDVSDWCDIVAVATGNVLLYLRPMVCAFPVFFAI